MKGKTEACCQVQPRTVQSARGHWSRSVGEIPSPEALGEFWRNKQSLHSVMITFVFISYNNNQRLATSVLTCWKRKSLPCLYGELTGGLTLQGNKEFSNISFTQKDQRCGNRNKHYISLQSADLSTQWCWIHIEFPCLMLSSQPPCSFPQGSSSNTEAWNFILSFLRYIWAREWFRSSIVL